jgi:hypothetical protein
VRNFLPSVQISPGRIVVRLREEEPARRLVFRCVLDRYSFGDVTGVEILDVKNQLDGAIIRSTTVTPDFRWSYSPEDDAFYLHIQRGPAPRQESVDGVALVSADNHLVCLELPA